MKPCLAYTDLLRLSEARIQSDNKKTVQSLAPSGDDGDDEKEAAAPPKSRPIWDSLVLIPEETEAQPSDRMDGIKGTVQDQMSEEKEDLPDDPIPKAGNRILWDVEDHLKTIPPRDPKDRRQATPPPTPLEEEKDIDD